LVFLPHPFIPSPGGEGAGAKTECRFFEEINGLKPLSLIG
jgi:hypothetical protein